MKKFTRRSYLKDPVLVPCVRAFDVLVPGWTHGYWRFDGAVGFINEFNHRGHVVTITDRELWGL